MAISDKLNYLLETKQAIKQAIIDKGQAVADTDTFRSYAEKIEAIEAGGGGGSGGAFDIEQVLNEATGAYELRITDAVGGEKEFTVMLPSAFATSIQIYYFQVNKEVILFSGNGTDVGLWKYTINTNTFEKLYNGRYFQYFKILNNKCFISSHPQGTSGLLIYDCKTNEFAKVGEGYQFTQFTQMTDTKWFIYSGWQGGSNLFKYDTLTNEIENLQDLDGETGSDYNLLQLNDDEWLVNSGYYNRGVKLYNSKDNTLTTLVKFVGNSSTQARYVPMKEDVLILKDLSGVYVYKGSSKTVVQLVDYTTDTSISSSTTNRVYATDNKAFWSGANSTYQGLWEYDTNTNTIFTIITTGYNYYMLPIENGILFSSNESGFTGLWHYNTNTNTTTKIYENGYKWDTGYNFNNKLFITCSKSTGGKGVLIYDINAQTITEGHTERYNWTIFTEAGSNLLITGPESNTVGVLLYKSSDNTMTHAYTTNGRWENIKKIGNDYLITSQNGGNVSNSGILLYDATTETVTRIYSNGSNYNIFIEVNGKWLLSSGDKSSQIILYDPETKTASVAYSSGNFWATYQNVNNDYLITNYNPNASPTNDSGILLYDSETEKVSKIFNYGANYDIFEFDENGNVYISGSNPKVSRYKLYYNATTKTATLAGYYVEVE